MLKIHDVAHEFKIDDGEWVRCGCSGWCSGDDAKIPEVLVIANAIDWELMRDRLESENADIYEGLYMAHTFFRRRPYIRAWHREWPEDSVCKLFPKDFKTISYRTTYKERRYVSVEWIFEHLHADDAIQYFKDRGMTICPIATH